MLLYMLIHYGSIAFLVAASSLGAAVGQGRIGRSSIYALNRQPSSQAGIFNAFAISMAIVETSSILGLIMGFFLLRSSPTSLYESLGSLGTACALGIPASYAGLRGSFSAESALSSIARQPLFAKKIIQLMILLQAVMQTPLIFGFISAFLIKSCIAPALSLEQALILCASGLCVGLGSLGTIKGISLFSKEALLGSSINKKIFAKLWSFSAMSISLIETSALFSFLVSLALLNKQFSTKVSLSQACIMLGAAFLMAVGTSGPAIQSGKTAAAAIKVLPLKPDCYQDIFRASLFGQVLIDSIAIYALLIALLLIAWG